MIQENIYLTACLVIALMFLDYFLTLIGYKFYKRTYARYVETESYELNPRFKDSVKKGTYSLKHFSGVIGVIAILFFIYFSANEKVAYSIDNYFFLKGFLLSMFVGINANHLQNILIFWFIQKDPTLLSGKLTQTLHYSLKLTFANALAEFLLLFSLFIFSPSAFTLGFALAPLIKAITLLRWNKKHLKQLNATLKASNSKVDIKK